jgi:DNA-binding XRE family transcriptional regulator
MHISQALEQLKNLEEGVEAQSKKMSIRLAVNLGTLFRQRKEQEKGAGRRMTQESLARSAGVSRATVNALFSGKCDPRLSTLALTASALGCSLEELLRPIELDIKL